MVGLSIIFKGVAVILGVNLLFLLSSGFVALRLHFRRRESEPRGARCSCCGGWDAEFSIPNVQGKFCKECCYELAEGLMFAPPSSNSANADAPQNPLD